MTRIGLERTKRTLPRGLAEVTVLVPALCLFSYWLAGEMALIALSVIAPAVWMLVTSLVRPDEDVVSQNGFGGEADLIRFLDPILQNAHFTATTTACFVVSFDDPARQFESNGAILREKVIVRTAERLSSMLRTGDIAVLMPGGNIGIGLKAVRRFDLETAIQLATRLRAAALVPLIVDDLTFHPSVSVGFCLAERAPTPLGAGLLDAARAAADEALFHGPGAIRAFQPDMSRRRADRAELRAGIETALDQGQIRPWFQPQIDADTGRIAGFEALARWVHPDRGVISPADFLPVIEDAGLSERLGEVILHGALSALARWDKAELDVPQVSINLSASELRAPGLAERIKWEVDRFGLNPSRLTVEVLETVAAKSEDDMIVTNLSALSRHGFGIDLDDFGTGQASITNIRRFSIRRIKIDRSFVSRVDADPEQKKIVTGILMLCDQLGLQTVAEGVETPGEHGTLAQLGCTVLQGFGIARPMAMEETFGWIERTQAAYRPLPPLGRTSL